MKALGNAIDDLARELYSGRESGVSTTQEPQITGRLCQRAEDRLDGTRVGEYVFHVVAHEMPDRGQKSLESITGADMLLSVSLDGVDRFDKCIFVQAKYDRDINRDKLQDACRRMERYVGKKGCYVWVYEPDGVRVYSKFQIDHMLGDSLTGLRGRSVESLTGRILDCYAGSRKWGIPMGPNRRETIAKRLREVRIDDALDVVLKRVGKRQ